MSCVEVTGQESGSKLSRLAHSLSVSMADMDVLAAMGISGFGKAASKKKLDPSRFDKNIRTEVSIAHIIVWIGFEH